MNSLNFFYRITKYNPLFRDSNGFYIPDEWTFFAQVGQKFNGKLFTYEEYVRFENCYIDAILSFMKELGLGYIFLRNLECPDRGLVIENLSGLNLRLFLDSIPPLGLIRVETVPLVCRLLLRDYIGGVLLVPGVISIDFGWDYYMYIATSKLCTQAINEVVSSGLFVEEKSSPWLESEDN